MWKSEQLVIGSITVRGGSIFPQFYWTLWQFGDLPIGNEAFKTTHRFKCWPDGFFIQQWNFLVVCFYYQMRSFTVDIGPFAHIVHSYLVLEVIYLRQTESHWRTWLQARFSFLSAAPWRKETTKTLPICSWTQLSQQTNTTNFNLAICYSVFP